jgi:hypothetical protein
MSAQHTPGPWRQGYTLTTKQTQCWTPEERAANDRRERLCVFANFTFSDEGRGRVLVAACRREEDAQAISVLPDLLKLCRAIDAHYSGSLDHQPAFVSMARAALVKATGGTS